MGDLRLGDALRVKHGYAFPGAEFSDNLEYPTLLTPGNFAIGGGFKSGKPKTFTGDVPRGYTLSPGSLVITMTDLSKQGDTLGLPARIPDDGIAYLHNQRIGLVEVTDSGRIDGDFLNYFLRTTAYRTHILGTASGSTVKHTSPGRIEAFVATVPSVGEQRSIAEVLDALDDKIAANDRTLYVADELCAAMVARARRGGETRALRELLVLKYGKSLPANQRVEGDVVVFGSGGPSGRHNAPLVGGPGIVLGRKGTVGAVYWADGPHFPIDTTYFVEPADDVPQEVLYYLLRRMPLAELNSDSAVPGLNREEAYAQEVRAPSRRDAARIGADIASRFAHMSAVRAESQCIARTRDELLPLLMSGKVRVKDAEKVVEEVL